MDTYLPAFRRTQSVVAWLRGQTGENRVANAVAAAVRDADSTEELAVQLATIAAHAAGSLAGGLLFRNLRSVSDTDWFAIASVLRNGPAPEPAPLPELDDQQDTVARVATPRPQLRVVTADDEAAVDPLAGDPNAPF